MKAQDEKNGNVNEVKTQRTRNNGEILDGQHIIYANSNQFNHFRKGDIDGTERK